jgi:hypothetical protein
MVACTVIWMMIVGLKGGDAVRPQIGTGNFRYSVETAHRLELFGPSFYSLTLNTMDHALVFRNHSCKFKVKRMF